MTMYEKILLDFYQAWITWANAGAPNNGVFRKNAGLCSNLRWFMWQDKSFNLLDVKLATNALQQQFRDAGLHMEYPFSDGDAGPYHKETIFCQSHLNSTRRNWVETKIKEMEACS